MVILAEVTDTHFLLVHCKSAEDYDGKGVDALIVEFAGQVVEDVGWLGIMFVMVLVILKDVGMTDVDSPVIVDNQDVDTYIYLRC